MLRPKQDASYVLERWYLTKYNSRYSVLLQVFSNNKETSKHFLHQSQIQPRQSLLCPFRRIADHPDFALPCALELPVISNFILLLVWL